MGRPETNWCRRAAMTQLGNGLYVAKKYEDALPVQEAELASLQRVDASVAAMFCVQNNLAATYGALGDLEKALSMERDIHSGYLKFFGEEHKETLIAAYNLASHLHRQKRYNEIKALLLRMIPAARRTLGDGYDLTLLMRSIYANALCEDDVATLDDVREAVEMLEETTRTARRVLGGAHPRLGVFEESLQNARTVLRARNPPSY